MGVLIDFEKKRLEKQQKKLGDSLNFRLDDIDENYKIKTDPKLVQKKIKFKIKNSEIREILKCINEHIIFLKEVFDNDCSIENEVKNLKDIKNSLNHKIENKTGVFLNVNYNSLESFIAAIELEFSPHIDLVTGELNTCYNENYNHYLITLKKIYDRLNPKLKSVEKILHPDIKEFKKIAEITKKTL